MGKAIEFDPFQGDPIESKECHKRIKGIFALFFLKSVTRTVCIGSAIYIMKMILIWIYH